MRKSSYEAYKRGWILRQERQERLLEGHRDLALEEARRLADILAKEFEVRKVLLVGSLAQGKHFHFGSDIDLAVAGLRESLFFKAVGRLLQVTGFDVDLKPLEAMDPSIRRRFETKGLLLYEKKGGEGEGGYY